MLQSPISLHVCAYVVCIHSGDSCSFCIAHNHGNHYNDEMTFKPLSTDFSHIKMMALLYLMAVCSGTVNYTAGGIGKA